MDMHNILPIDNLLVYHFAHVFLMYIILQLYYLCLDIELRYTQTDIHGSINMAAIVCGWKYFIFELLFL